MKILLTLVIAAGCICYPANGDARKASEAAKQANFDAVIRSLGRAEDVYVVFTTKDMNTGKTKDICCKSRFLHGALFYEHGEFDITRYAGRRYFEFRNRRALENTGFFDYDEKRLQIVARQFNIPAICLHIMLSGSWEYRFAHDEHPTMEYLAHLLFNRGFLTWESSCFGGALYYTSRGLWVKIELGTILHRFLFCKHATYHPAAWGARRCLKPASAE